jgi:hypothetical protein
MFELNPGTPEEAVAAFTKYGIEVFPHGAR